MPRRPEPSSLTLGTAAFGMPYGVGNPPRSPSAEAVDAMLDRAWDGGITSFDTAPAYGEAEVRLGRWVKRRGIAPLIATKLPPLTGVVERDTPRAVSDAIDRSTERLGTPPAWYLTHGIKDYLNAAVREALKDAAARGRVGAVGVSIYTDADVRAALAAGPPDVIQLPVNALDQRLADGGAIEACAAAGATVFARSVFLQGVILMQPEQLPAHLEGLKKPLAQFEVACARARTARASAALRSVRDLPGVASTVVGAYSLAQLRALIAAAVEPPVAADLRAAILEIANTAPAYLLDPRNWQTP